MRPIDWQRVDLAIFDLDGTLYDQRRLRARMAMVLGWECLKRPSFLRSVRVLVEFRRIREELARSETPGIERLQFDLPAQRLGLSSVVVEEIVNTWVMQRPLRHLFPCRFPGVWELFATLRARGTVIGVLSDYPAEAKLRALELAADLLVVATDPDVDRLKPHPAGLERLLSKAGVAADRCLLIGDREDRDGECARRLGVPYLLKTGGAPGREDRFADFRELLSSLGRASDSRQPVQ